MMRVISALTILALGAASLPAGAAPKAPIALAKTTKWEINYDTDSCHLMARFGNGTDSALLKLSRTSPSDYLQMTVFGKMLDHRGIALPIEIGFGAQPVPFTRNGVAVTAGADKVPGVIIEGLRVDGWEYPQKAKEPFAIPAVTPAAEGAVTSITFKKKGGKAYRLDTGSMAAPLAAMRTCTDDLLVHWGFDPKVQAKLTRHPSPIGNPANWLNTNDFPSKALDRGHNGYVSFRLIVEADGKVSGCRVLFRTNPDEFADLSCKLMVERAKMRPALDADGKPVRSYYVSRIKWVSGDW